MDRLTHRDNSGEAYTHAVDDMNVFAEPQCRYDERGMPVLENFAKEMRGSVVDRLSQYEDAEEAGKLLTLPCAIGDKIYRIEKRKGKDVIAAHVVEKFEIGTSGMYLCFGWRGMGYEVVRFNDIGKTVFLTREEAEAELKGENK